jgi:HSP20 family molecular chaperone IbpA
MSSSLPALSTFELSLKEEFKSEIAQFWERKGSTLPPFDFVSAEPLIDEASEIVVRLWSLAGVDPRPKLRASGGASREALLNTYHLFSDSRLIADPNAFVTALVHAAFSVTERPSVKPAYGLTVDQINGMIEQVRESRAAQRNAEEGALEHELTRLFRLLEGELTPHLKAAGQGELSGSVDGVSCLRSLNHDLSSALRNAVKLTEIADDAATAKAAAELVDEVTKKGSSKAARRRRRASKKAKEDEEEEEAEAAAEEQEAAGAEAEDEPMADEPAAAASGSSSDGEDSAAAALEAERAEHEKAYEAGKLAITKVTSNVEEQSTEMQSIERLVDEFVSTYEKNTKDSARDKLKQVDRLQKQCLSLGETLMRNLLELDSVTGAAELRPLRKRAVGRIQGLLDEVDSIRTKLKVAHAELAPKAKEEEEAAKAAEAERKAEEEAEAKRKAEEAAAAASATASSAAEEEESDDAAETGTASSSDEDSAGHAGGDGPTDAEWLEMRMDPDIRVSQRRDGAYLLEGYVPGMRDEDVGISLDEERGALVIKGARVPTPAERDALLAQLRKMLLHPAYRGRRPQSAAEVHSLLLRTGAGRFGSFETRYRIPADADASRVQASYTDGTLRVVIPRRVQARRPAVPQRMAGGDPYGLFGSPYGRPRQAHPGFW